MSKHPWQRRFTVEGLNLARFIRQAGEMRIPLARLQRPTPGCLAAQAPEDALPALCALAERGGWQLTQGRRVGLGRWMDWLRTRWLLCACSAAALAVLLAATQVVWTIEIVEGGAYAVDIRQAVAELGVSAPMLRRHIDLGALRDALEWRYPRVAWVECGFRGVALVVRPVQGVLPLQDRADGPCDIVAARDGVIHHIVTRAGTPVVSVGDVVRAGQVLIRGEERTSDGAVRPVAARGTVMARVWLGAEVRMSARETLTTYTGNETTVWTVRTPWFDLWPLPASAYAHQDVALRELPLMGFFLPLTLRIETRLEAEHTTQMREMAELKADAQAAAARKLHEKLLPGESLIDIWGNCSMIDDENVSAVAMGEMLVDIGARSSDMAATEGPAGPVEQPR